MAASRENNTLALLSSRTGRRCLVAGILAAATLLRFAHLGASPGWFLDEGAYFDVARNLLQGRRLVGQMEVTFAAPHMTAPPAFFVAEAAWMAVGGLSMAVFRAGVAACGILCVVLVGAIARRLAGWPTALWAMAFLAFLPHAVLFSRLALPYTPAVALTLIWAWCLLAADAERNRGRRAGLLTGATVAAALAPLTLYYAVVLIPAGTVWAIASWRGSRHLRHGLILIPSFACLLALGLFLLLGLHLWSPQFAVDLHALGDDATAGTLGDQIRHWGQFLFHWTIHPQWPERIQGFLPVLGFAGLLLLRRHPGSAALATTAFFYAHIVLRRADAQVAFVDYPMAPVLPFLAIGLGALAARIPSLVVRFGLRGMHGISKALIRTTALALLALLAAYSALAVYSRWERPQPPSLSFGMIESMSDARVVAKWVNSHLATRDGQSSPSLVLASYNLWPLLTVPHSDINQLMGARGKGSGFYDYDCAPEATAALRAGRIAAFIEDSITDIRRAPAVKPTPGIGPGNPWMDLAQTMQYYHNAWPVAFQRGEYRVRVPRDSVPPPRLER